MINMNNERWFHILYQLVHRCGKVITDDVTSIPYLFTNGNEDVGAAFS